MKPSKKVRLIIGIVIFAIVLAVLFTIYSRQAGEREQLENNLWAAQILSAKLTTQKEDLGDQLTQAQSLLDSSRKKFPESVDSIEYGEDLFEIADDCDVELTSLSMSKPTGSATYSTSSFAVNVNGDVSDILDFVDALRAGVDFQLPWSAEVTAVRINYGGGEGTAGTATISLNIYAYEGE
jgi:type II secretory pathway pseudopilin PulG